MKRLTEEEAAEIKVIPRGRGTLLRHHLLSMKLGEIMLIEPHEFKWKGKPLSTYLRRLEESNKMKFTCGKALDGSGWVVKRVG